MANTTHAIIIKKGNPSKIKKEERITIVETRGDQEIIGQFSAVEERDMNQLRNLVLWSLKNQKELDSLILNSKGQITYFLKRDQGINEREAHWDIIKREGRLTSNDIENILLNNTAVTTVGVSEGNGEFKSQLDDEGKKGYIDNNNTMIAFGLECKKMVILILLV